MPPPGADRCAEPSVELLAVPGGHFVPPRALPPPRLRGCHQTLCLAAAAPQRLPQCQKGEKWPQNRAQTAPEWERMAPGNPERVKNGSEVVRNGRKMGKNGSKVVQNGTKMAKMAEKWHQNGPKWHKNGTKMAQKWSKMAEKWAKMAQKWAKMAPKWSILAAN